MDKAHLEINGKMYSGWKSFAYTRGIHALAGAFSVSYSDKWLRNVKPLDINAGDQVKVVINDEIVLDGFIDKRSIRLSSEEREISAIGRDKTADLVDCSVLQKPFIWNNIDIKKLAGIISKPFGINAIECVDPGDKFDTISAQQGETVYALLEKYARQRGLLIYGDGKGGVVIARPGKDKLKGALIEGENIKAITDQDDLSKRFSEYHVKGQASGASVNLFGEKASHIEGISTDDVFNKAPYKERYRPLLVVSETAAQSGLTQQRAQWEASVRLANSYTVSVVVAGWSQSPHKDLWTINKQVYLKSPSLRVDGLKLVKSVMFSHSEKGSETRIQLVNEDSFKLQPDIKTKKITNDLGLG